ncbi:hypothetical protein [Micromonospora sp. NPDC005172]|uniref:hypothetical protein n=1 Tax=Micromonospora sp. NPDC005172 TaxID=3156867 RepID=UPI0033B895D5
MSETPSRLLLELEQVGVRVDDVWELVNTAQKYPTAIPVLLRWLDRINELPVGKSREKLREGLIRALSVPYARGQAAPLILKQFNEISDMNELGLKWVAGSALGVVADVSVADEVVEILLDRSLGRAREMVFEAIPRIANSRPEIVDGLRSLLDDEAVVPFVICALGQLRDVQSREEIASFVASDHPLASRQARTALRRLDAELARREAANSRE